MPIQGKDDVTKTNPGTLLGILYIGNYLLFEC